MNKVRLTLIGANVETGASQADLTEPVGNVVDFAVLITLKNYDQKQIAGRLKVNEVNVAVLDEGTHTHEIESYFDQLRVQLLERFYGIPLNIADPVHLEKARDSITFVAHEFEQDLHEMVKQSMNDFIVESLNKTLN